MLEKTADMNQTAKNSYKTAIKPRTISAPSRYLLKHGYISDGATVLDFECGHSIDIYWMPSGGDVYDSILSPIRLTKKYDVILCHYVLNTLLKQDERKVLRRIKTLLNDKGHAYITVRRNVKKNGYTKTGTYQRNVKLPLSIVEENNDFCIYDMTR